jgi:hypothetical protein
MKKLAILFVIIIGCTSTTGIIERTASDYLKLAQGNRWTYLKNAQDTILREVLGDTTLLGDSALVIDTDGFQEYVQIFDEGLLRYERFVTYQGGQEVLLEERFGLWIESPLVLGNTWTDTFSAMRAFGADTFQYTHIVEGDVEEIVGLTAENESFAEVYRVGIRNRYRLVTPNETTEETEDLQDFFAPGVGLVKRIRSVYDGDTLVDSLVILSYEITE